MSVRYDIDDAVARITVDRRHDDNALDTATATLLKETIERTATDYSRAVLVMGAGDAFCTGVDSSAIAAAQDPASDQLKLSAILDAAFRALGSMPKPVIAAVRGDCSGAGLALALSCDLIVAGDSARFTMGYAASGPTPDGGVSWLLPRAVGQQRALEMALTRRSLDGPTAVDWGLATMTTSDIELRATAFELATRLASGPAWSYGQARRLLRRSWEASREETAGDEAITIARAAIMPTAPGDGSRPH